MIFISFLGTGSYLNCNYIYGKQRCENVFFIQTAIRDLFASKAEKNLIFVTEAAERKNLTGLQEEAVGKNLSPMTPVCIPEGASEGQLWEIFRTISEKIPEGEEIIFDITHSLRSLPTLMTILVNYLTVVKKTSLQSCYYGAFEKLGPPDKVKTIPIEKRDAPIFNVTPFFELNKWTRAIDDFTRYGHAGLLVEMVEKGTVPVITNNTGEEKVFAYDLKKAVENIGHFSRYIHTSNQYELCKMDIQTRIVERLVSLEKPRKTILSLTPIARPLKNIQSFFSDYENSTFLNGFRAARDCARFHLIPQGFTILQETIISLETEKYQNKMKEAGLKKERGQRQFISALLGYSPKTDSMGLKDVLQQYKLLTESIRDNLDENFLGNYKGITEVRNRLNHGGTNPDNRINKKGDFVDKLKEQACSMLDHYRSSRQ